jgi:hypothetical protein
MEDKKNLKRPRSPSDEGSSSSSKASTPPPSRSGCPPPTQSPLATSSRRLCLPPCEQGGPSESVPVVDLALSSGEEESIADTSRDEKFDRKLFGDLNRDILGSSGDGKIIVISDSDDEDETPSTPRLLHLLLPTPRTPPLLHLMSMKHPMGCQMIMLMVGTKPVHLRSSM